MEVEDVCDAPWAERSRMTPRERRDESEELWSTYLARGGSLDPEPDTRSPFLAEQEDRERKADREYWQPPREELMRLRRRP